MPAKQIRICRKARQNILLKASETYNLGRTINGGLTRASTGKFSSWIGQPRNPVPDGFFESHVPGGFSKKWSREPGCSWWFSELVQETMTSYHNLQIRNNDKKLVLLNFEKQSMSMYGTPIFTFNWMRSRSCTNRIMIWNKNRTRIAKSILISPLNLKTTTILIPQCTACFPRRIWLQDR